MIHKVVGWFKGYVRFYICGHGAGRFVNLCHNKGIELWNMKWDKDGKVLYCFIMLKDFYLLRPLARKCHVMPVITERYGMPFIIQMMGNNKSFCTGIVLFFMIIILLSTRIWGISVEGEKYHTKESILKYLNERDVYGGMAVKDVKCSNIRYDMRHSFDDIGWVSVELKGSMLYVRIREVQLIEENEEKKKGSLISEDTGRVVSIVTSSGTPKVMKGDKVKKGQVLISGVDKIIGDNDEVVRKRKVRAEGEVIVQSVDRYDDKINVRYKKKIYTGRHKNLYEISAGKYNIFLHNPLNDLETYSKCDIIREGGRLCPLLSLRFPVSIWRQSFKEVSFEESEYSRDEAVSLLKERFKDYLSEIKKDGYKIVEAKLSINKSGNEYTASADIVRRKMQDSYKKIKDNKGKKSDGNYGNGN